MHETVLGKDDPTTLKTGNNLVSLYLTQKRFSEAKTLAKRNLSLAKKALDKKDPILFASYKNMVVLYSGLNQPKDVEPLLKQVVMLSGSNLGSDHPDTQAALIALARFYERQGRKREADALRQRIRPTKTDSKPLRTH
jgi:tetratricopeptide (TPR) repeat protein